MFLDGNFSVIDKTPQPLKGAVHTKMTILIVYSLSCHPKRVKISFVCRTQIKYILRNIGDEASLATIDFHCMSFVSQIILFYAIILSFIPWHAVVKYVRLPVIINNY